MVVVLALRNSSLKFCRVANRYFIKNSLPGTALILVLDARGFENMS
jgi:hypothetical protein